MALSAAANVIWHDLECGLYNADLPLWRELAAGHREGPILDIGAGTGRVSLDLAITGRAVIALDRDPELLAALRERAAGAGQNVETVCADARDFKLDLTEGLDLALVPMQTVQLLGGSEQRGRFLRAVSAHLRPGGLLACALVTELEAFDCRAGGPGPSPESVNFEGQLYSSHALRVELGEQQVTIERERRVSRAPSAGERPRETGRQEPHAEQSSERNLIELDRLTARELEREAAAVGLRAEPTRTIAPTDEHTGSTVVMLRA
jgi:SAM-dependent methyltransferase